MMHITYKSYMSYMTLSNALIIVIGQFASTQSNSGLPNISLLKFTLFI